VNTKIKLTPEQEERVPFYRDKWLQIGLNTDRYDEKEVEYWIRECYHAVNITPPKEINHTLSPLASLKEYENITGNNAKQEIGGFAYGSHEAGWLCVYDFYLNECHLTECEKLVPLMQLAQVCGWWLPYPNLAIASQRPVTMSMENGRLHCGDGPACGYEDKFRVWSLNGVRVTQEIAETAPDDMRIELWADEVNAEVRHEVEKKMTSERVLELTDGKPINIEHVNIAGVDHTYTLLELKLPNGDIRRSLDMTNPTTGEKHKEWVPPECRDVMAALRFRNGTSEIPVKIT
jgi:hypothetical protein